MKSMDQIYSLAANLPAPWTDLPEEVANARAAVFDKTKDSAAVFRGFVPSAYEAVNNIYKALGVEVRYDHPADPNYDSEHDTLHMPHPAAFVSPDDYARTLLHELSHWTMNHGIKRPFPQATTLDWIFGEDYYAMEELSAETAVSIMIEELAMPSGVADYSLQYIRAWLKNGTAGGSPAEQRALLARTYPVGASIASFLLSKR